MQLGCHIDMNTSTLLSPLSRYELTHLSAKNVTLYSLLTLSTFLFLLHVLSMLARSEVLDTFADDHFFKAKQVAFQMQKSLVLTQADKKEPCSDADIAELRSIKHTFFFVGSLGRVINKKIACTAESGRLDPPITLPPLHTVATNGFEYRNSQNDFIHHNTRNPPMVTYQDAVALPSQAYIQLTERFFSTVDGMAGIIYFEANTRYIHSSFGLMVPDEFDSIISHKNTIMDWVPIPNRMRSKNQCNDLYNVCIAAIDRRLGLYSLSPKTLGFILPLLLIISIAFGLMIEHFRVGPRALARKLKKHIRQDNIFPVYQPQVKIDTQEIIGVESLARWHDTVLGPISPDVFIPVAEASNLIENLTEKLLVRILNDLHKTLENNPSFTVSINISTELLTSDTFVNFLNMLTATYNFNRNQIILEVTERTSSDQEKMASFSQSLQSQGYLVSIDDFGTGVSNLSWLSTLDPSEIKVDKIFTQAIGTETVNYITLGGIFSMLEHLAVKVVFEGIETEAQRHYIHQKIPNAIGQGWLFAKPQKISALLEMIQSTKK